MSWFIECDPFIQVFAHDFWLASQLALSAETAPEKSSGRIVILQGVAAGWRDVKLFNIQTAATVVIARIHVVRVGDKSSERQFDGDDFTNTKAAYSVAETDRKRNTAILLSVYR